jgi:hypothetical protein
MAPVYHANACGERHVQLGESVDENGNLVRRLGLEIGDRAVAHRHRRSGGEWQSSQNLGKVEMGLHRIGAAARDQARLPCLHLYRGSSFLRALSGSMAVYSGRSNLLI